MMVIDFSALSRLPLFRGIAPVDLPHLCNCLGCYTKSYTKKDFIRFEDNKIFFLACICQGSVQMITEDTNGTKSIIISLREGDIFGEDLSCYESNSAIEYLAMPHSKITFFSINKVMNFCTPICHCHSIFLKNVIAALAQKNSNLIRKNKIMSQRTLREKLILYFQANFAKDDPTAPFTIPFGRLDLANYLCVDRSSLTRELTNMRKEGLIDFSRNTFSIKPLLFKEVE